MQKINWYVGHMAKSVSQIKQQINKVDLVIQVLDARCINISSNQELLTICKNKPIINIALKSDLADLNNKNNYVYYLDINQKSFVSNVQKIIENKLANQIAKFKAKGLVNPHFYCIVLGLPNIGKSSFINAFGKKNKVIVQNCPGVTKTINLIKVNKYCSIYDTPGIVVKNITNLNDGYILGLIGSISKKVLPIDDVVKFAFDFYKKFYFRELQKYFGFKNECNYQEFLDYIINKYKFIGKHNNNDYTKAYDFLFNVFVNNKVCKVDYEKK